MTTRQPEGGRRHVVARWGICLLLMTTLSGCAARGADPAVMDNLAEMQIRLRLVQSELADVRRAVAEEQTRSERRGSGELALESRLDDLQQRIAELPAQMADACPTSSSSTLNARCDASPVQRVVVSGDKLVVGELERVWLEPPTVLLVARIDAGAEHSLIDAREIVEFERDGNKWVRFGIDSGKDEVNVERPLKRIVRIHDDKRPMVELRVQLGDVRETVEFALMDLSDPPQPLVLGRNFLTDVALVDVGRKYVQPASKAPAK